ncbi:methyltransferase, putative [Bodo saltans]|uniref:Methyltransferase, putative n=1 Tax=Bodo saltans TaxID=75058 RepID=A0A0S4IMS4_BODSA|nr:methyltransferase, putative [Bodo saltans]|eukprot:CUE74310.1 methyltransferase, putative [Bodo saltans]
MSHADGPSELFEVGAHGDVSLSRVRVDVSIFCSTPLAHLGKCATKQRQASTDGGDHSEVNPPSSTSGQEVSTSPTSEKKEESADTCSTGLRVYDGAMVLAEFFASKIFSQSQLFQQFVNNFDSTTSPVAPSSSDLRHFVALELGCGCGLAGLTLWHVLSQEKHIIKQQHDGKNKNDVPPLVVLTDASKPCLEFVHRNYDALKTSTARLDDSVDTNADLDIRVLDWEQPASFFSEGSEDAGKFWAAAAAVNAASPQQHLGESNARRRGGADIVFGSDLVYFNASPFSLFNVAEKMMRYDGNNDEHDEAQQPVVATSLVFPPVLVLCHHCRIANGVAILNRAASAAGLTLFSLSLASFLPETEISSRCRGGMHFLIGCRTHDAAKVQRELFSESAAGQGVVLNVFCEGEVDDTAAAMMMCGLGDDE